MTIYVDAVFTATPAHAQARRAGTRWCHMFSDALDLTELHAMATQLRLRPYFQDRPTLPHYDLTPNKRAQAIALGAVAITDEENKRLVLAQVALRRAHLKGATPMNTSAITPEALAQFFHDTYERLAPSYGYKTREESAVSWESVPHANKTLMIAVCADVLDLLRDQAKRQLITDFLDFTSQNAADITTAWEDTEVFWTVAYETERDDLRERSRAILEGESDANPLP